MCIVGKMCRKVCGKVYRNFHRNLRSLRIESENGSLLLGFRKEVIVWEYLKRDLNRNLFDREVLVKLLML